MPTSRAGTKPCTRSFGSSRVVKMRWRSKTRRKGSTGFSSKTDSVVRPSRTRTVVFGASWAFVWATRR